MEVVNQKSPAQFKLQSYMFVLWGENFEESIAMTLTIQWRQAGLRVKVIGLYGPSAKGVNGVIVSSDWSLGKALKFANQASCVVIPCGPSNLKRLNDDPRFQDFLHQAHANNATFVLGQMAGDTHQKDVDTILPPTNKIVTCPANEDLVQFSRELALSL